MLQIYAEKLIEEQIIQKDDIENFTNAVNTQIETAYERVHGSECPFAFPIFYDDWGKFSGNYCFDPVDTGVNKKTLLALAHKLD